MRFFLLLLTTILPDLATTTISAYFLLRDWAALSHAHQHFDQIFQSPQRTLEALTIAQAAEQRHRLNCFAEGEGILLGGVWTSIGIHGICTITRHRNRGALSP